jgi:hypothetical protein
LLWMGLRRDLCRDQEGNKDLRLILTKNFTETWF